jgi:hypothetical protein
MPWFFAVVHPVPYWCGMPCGRAVAGLVYWLAEKQTWEFALCYSGREFLCVILLAGLIRVFWSTWKSRVARFFTDIKPAGLLLVCNFYGENQG